MVIVPSAKPEPGNSRRTRCPIHLCPVDCQAISSPSSSMMKTRAEQLWVLSVLLSLHEKIGGSPREGRAHGDKALHLPPTGAPGESKSCAIILCQSTPSVHDGDDGLPIPLRSLHSGPRSMTHQHASPQLERECISIDAKEVFEMDWARVGALNGALAIVTGAFGARKHELAARSPARPRARPRKTTMLTRSPRSCLPPRRPEEV